MSTNPRLMLMVLVAAAVLIWPKMASAVAWTFDSVTYTPPEGFSPIMGGPADRADWKRVDGASYCEIAVFWASDASQNVMADHTRQWARLADGLLHTGNGTQPSSSTTPSGAQLVVSIGRGRLNGAPVVVMLYTVHGAGRVTPILILVPSADALQAYGRTIQSFASSLVAHPTWKRPANLPANPLRVRISDLTGAWQRGSGNVVNYVNSWGAITGSNTTFFNEIATVAPDGSYESSMTGMTGGRAVREKVTGKWTLDGELLIVTQAGHSTKRLRLALFLDGSDTTVIGLVPEDRAVSLTTINGTGEYWARKKIKR